MKETLPSGLVQPAVNTYCMGPFDLQALKPFMHFILITYNFHLILQNYRVATVEISFIMWGQVIDGFFVRSAFLKSNLSFLKVPWFLDGTAC